MITNILTASQTLECRRILKIHPLFAILPSQDINEISNHFFSQEFKKDEIILTEGDLIDSIYFVVQGKVEISKKLSDKEESVPIATLVPNEALGLSSTGYYSATGKRTASAIAITDGMLFGIHIRELNHFLSKHNQFQQSLKQYSQLLLRMNFIKQVAPFSEFTIDELIKYANQLEEINVAKEEIIFNQGEEAKKCYLICEGKVEILIINENNDLEKIAVLESPAIFGETALLMPGPRNATVRTMTDCHLLVIDSIIFNEMLKNQNTAETLMHIISRRNRPKPVNNIETYSTKNADNNEIVILKNPHNGKYCRLTKEGWFIWQQLDGKKSLRDITNSYFNQFHVFNPGFVSTVVDDLARMGFISTQEVKDPELTFPWWIKVFNNLKKMLQIDVTFYNVDPWLTKIYSGGLYLLFNKWIQILFLIVSLSGFVIFLIQANSTLTIIKSIGNVKWWLLVATLASGVVIVFLHELAHALTTKRFGQHVKLFGFGWLLFGPAAFCDTSDMWLCTHYSRVLVDLAGIYMQMLMAGSASIIALLIHMEYLQLFLWLFALYNYLLIFWNLTPIFDLDGYYILMDWFDEPNLKTNSIVWLIEKLPHEYNQKGFVTTYKKEIMYWTFCMLFIVLEFIIPFVAFKYLFAAFLHVSNPLYSFILAVLAVILSILGIWFEIKRVKMDIAKNKYRLR